MFSKQLLTIALIAVIGNALNLTALNGKKPIKISEDDTTTDDNSIPAISTGTTTGSMGSDPCTWGPDAWETNNCGS